MICNSTPPAGFVLDDMKDFNSRIFKLLAKEMKVDDMTVLKEDLAATTAEAEEEVEGGSGTCWFRLF